MTDLFVDAHDGIRLAVRDHGGDGAPLVLMHGAGSHLLSLENLAAELADFRVVTMDARWCGWSGDSAAYSWDDLVADVDAVVDALSLGPPVVAGHSWGGMIAAYWGIQHPEAPAVINLDGHGSGDLSLYDGMSADDHAAGMALIDQLNSGPPVERSGDAAWYEAAREVAIEMARAMRVPDDRAVEYAERSFVRRDDGTWELRPSPVMMTGLRGDLGLLDVYRRVRCPLLVLDCTRHQRGLPAELEPFMAAYRRGLGRALDGLAAEHPNIEISHHHDVDHLSIAGKHAPVIAEVMRSFVARHASGS